MSSSRSLPYAHSLDPIPTPHHHILPGFFAWRTWPCHRFQWSSWPVERLKWCGLDGIDLDLTSLCGPCLYGMLKHQPEAIKQSLSPQEKEDWDIGIHETRRLRE